MGLDVVDHPLLSAVADLPGDEGLLFTGRITLATHPWLADHAMLGTVLLPGTALVELASWTGRQAGAATVAELNLEAPLAIPTEGGSTCGSGSARRTRPGTGPVAIHSRRDDDTGPDGSRAWQRHASGQLADTADPEPAPAAVWPPADAEPIALDGLYARLAAQGYHYGPVFRALRAGVAVGAGHPRRGRPGRRRVHRHHGLLGAPGPDGRGAARHRRQRHGGATDAGRRPAGGASGAEGGPDIRPGLPFTWSGVTIRPTRARELRIRLRATDAASVALTITDTGATPVASVDGLVLRPISGEQLSAARRSASRSLHRLDWVAPATGRADGTSRLVVLGDDWPGADRHPDLSALVAEVRAGGPVPDAVVVTCVGPAADEPHPARPGAPRSPTARSRWPSSGSPRSPSTAARLVVVTRGAVRVDPDERIADVPAAAAWGLLRSAQSENPDRIVLVDLDDDDAPAAALLPAAAGHAANRSSRCATARLPVPRLARLGRAPAERVAARDLAARHGAGHRRHRRARARWSPGTWSTAARRTAPAAGQPAAAGGRPGRRRAGRRAGRAGRRRARVAACDVADRDALAACWSPIPADRPLTGVVHAAGVLDDGVARRADPGAASTRVLRPKVDAAWHLHELTRDAGPGRVRAVLLGGRRCSAAPGRPTTRRRNAFLDALAAAPARPGPARGLAGLGAVGPTTPATGRPGHVDEARMTRGGFVPLGAERGHGAVQRGAALRRAGARTGQPGPRRCCGRHGPARGAAGAAGLVRPATPARPAPPSATPAEALRATAGRPTAEADRDQVLLDLVRTHAAAVLGHASTGRSTPSAASSNWASTR